MRIPFCIYLYDGSKLENLKLEEIVEYLRNKLGNMKIERRDDFISFYLRNLYVGANTGVRPNHQGRHIGLPLLAEKLAKSRIRPDSHRDNNHQEVKPLPMEIEYEKKNLFYKSFGVLYDGFKLSILFAEMISENDPELDSGDLGHCHIIFTNQLFGTWDENDKRYHARVSIYGFPTIISTTGIVEAPAKPREFYIRQRFGLGAGLKPASTLEEEFKGRFIEYNDPRITEVMKGYVMQAIFFHITGNPFCEDKNCRLYNAHWQEEVIQAQLKGYEFCNKHQQILNKIRNR